MRAQCENSGPLITIGVSCYREGEWLRECWESVLAQTDDRWEAVLVMDGGADEPTRAVFQEIEHPKLRKFTFDKNMGPYPVRNKAFEMTRTPYHFYLDGDDQLPPNAVELGIKALCRNPKASILVGDIEYFGAHTGLRRRPHEITASVVATRGMNGGGGAVYRKTLWEELGGYSTELSHATADLDFYIGAIEAGHAIGHVGGTLYCCRCQSKANSKRWLKSLWARAELMARRHPSFFAERGLLRAFLTRTYESSFQACWSAGDLSAAREIAGRAVVKRSIRWKAFRMWFLAVTPEQIARRLILAKQTVSRLLYGFRA